LDKNSTLKICDLLGHIVYEEKLLAKETTLDLKGLKISTGMYAVIIQTESNFACIKLMVR